MKDTLLSSGLFTTLTVVCLIVVGSVDGRQECRQVADFFNGLRLPAGHHAPLDKINDTELEVCTPAARGGPRSKTCCTRAIERRLHHMAVDDIRQSLESLTIWKRMVGLELLTGRHRDELRKQLLVAANITIEELQIVHEIHESECNGCVSRMFVDLGEYLRVNQRPTDTFDFRSHVARLLDSLFATVYFRHVSAGSSGTSGGRPTSASSHRQQQQHFQQQQQYMECAASVRRQLEQPPLQEIEVRLAEDLEKSIGITRLLLEAYDLAADTIRRTTRGPGDQSTSPTSSTTATAAAGGLVAELFSGHQCSRAVMRMRPCALCDGYDNQKAVKPCRGLCLNVARGCLSPLIAGENGGLGHAWDLFVNVVAQLEHSIRRTYDIDLVLAGVVSRLSKGVGDLKEAVQKINGSQITAKCGHYAGVHTSGRQRTVSDSASPTLPPAIGSHQRNRFPKVMVDIRQMAMALAATNGFFSSRLPENLCRAEGMALDNCWNGTAVDRLVTSVSMHDYPRRDLVESSRVGVVN